MFSGHDHSYARTMVLKNGQPVSEATQNGRLPATYGKGVLYYICGDLGEKSRSTEYKAVNNPDFHFAQVSQEYDSLYLAVEATADAMTVRHLLRQRRGRPVLAGYLHHAGARLRVPRQGPRLLRRHRVRP